MKKKKKSLQSHLSLVTRPIHRFFFSLAPRTGQVIRLGAAGSDLWLGYFNYKSGLYNGKNKVTYVLDRFIITSRCMYMYLMGNMIKSLDYSLRRTLMFCVVIQNRSF